MTTPLEVIAKGIEINPTITKALIAVPVMVAVLALCLSLIQDWQTALIGGVFVMVAAVLLLGVAQLSAKVLGDLGTWLARFCLLFFAAVATCLLSSVMFDWPKAPACLVRPLEPCGSAIAAAANRQAPAEPVATAVNRAFYTVYTQFAGYQRPAVQRISEFLKSKGWQVPGEERKAEASGLSEVRYRNSADRPAAELLASEIMASGISERRVSVRQLGIIRPNQLEVWISR